MCSIDPLFCILSAIESFYWSYIGFSVVLAAGMYFSFRSGFYQLKVLAHPIRTIKAVQKSSEGGGGISPFRVYFASVGGMVGLGNIVGVVTAVTLGGPGALFWLWVASLFGMLIKYAEIYLGMKFRINDEEGRHHGGPMIYLRKAFRSPFLSKVVPIIYCSLLAIYGVEIYQFVVITDILTDTTSLPRILILLSVLTVTLYGGFGGIRRLANISTALMPPFIVGYIGLSLYVIALHITDLPYILLDVFRAAFTGHAAMGGFAGSTMLMALQLGTARAVYSGDLGIGYDSIIQSESKARDPSTQACLSIFGVATDSIVCTMSILVVLVTGIWKTGIQACHAVSHAFSQFFPHVDIFMAILIFIAGYTTLIAYLAVGEKAMQWLFPQWGRRAYFLYATVAFTAFSFLDQCHVMTVMMLSGGLLMLTNLLGIWQLRHEVVFKNEFLKH
ncbi:MAG: sodium:alanine symporter family protein [Proteobacteria bacterium]|nr:sodium:alanine symporter family protein [Pseudomonadota bacterium]